MGAIMSLNSSSSSRVQEAAYEIQSGDNCKRRRISSEENTRLIPSLPDEISLQILARIPRILYLNIKSVSRAWKNAVMSTELYSLRKELGTTEEWLYVLTKVDEEKLIWHALDPLSRKWQRLPLMPVVSFNQKGQGLSTTLRTMKVMGSSLRIADSLKGWLGRKMGTDRMALCGCSVGAVDGCLYVIGGFSNASALTSVWRYYPTQNAWSEASPMLTGRAYCKTGTLNGKLYVVGGVTQGRAGLAPFQSAEVYDPKTGDWAPLPSMPFSKAQVLPTAFLTDLLKPIATGMTSYRGRLFVPQSLYCWPFFVDVGGEAYDPDTNTWVEMPLGMGEGWPARQAGSKLSVAVEGELYSLDPCTPSLGSAKIKVYDHQNDAWKVVTEDVPVRDFTGSESPYLLASLLGRLHVITRDANSHIVIMQADARHNVASLEGSSLTGAEPESSLWRVIATMNTGSAELVSCQNLDI